MSDEQSRLYAAQDVRENTNPTPNQPEAADKTSPAGDGWRMLEANVDYQQDGDQELCSDVWCEIPKSHLGRMVYYANTFRRRTAQSQSETPTPDGDPIQDMRDYHHYEEGIYDARKGVHELLCRDDGEAIDKDWDAMLPVARFEWFFEKGDRSVGIQDSAFWMLAENQSGTILEQLQYELSAALARCAEAEKERDAAFNEHRRIFTAFEAKASRLRDELTADRDSLRAQLSKEAGGTGE